MKDINLNDTIRSYLSGEVHDIHHDASGDVCCFQIIETVSEELETLASKFAASKQAAADAALAHDLDASLDEPNEHDSQVRQTVCFFFALHHKATACC